MRFVRHRTAESTPAPRLQPAARAALWLGVAAALLGTSSPVVQAQQTIAIGRSDTPLLAAPGGARLGRVIAGSSFRATGSRGGFTQLAVEGWIRLASLRAEQKDGHTLAVDKAPEERLRAASDGPVVAVLVRGALLDEVERKSGWVHVRRSGWIVSGAVRSAPPPVTAAHPATPAPAAAPPAARPGAAAPVPAAAARPGAATPAPAGRDTLPVDASLALVRQRAELRSAPNAPATGTLEADAPVRIVSRAGEWVRVETQGWVRQGDLKPPAGEALDNVTAAQLRDDPEGFRGQLLRWTIQYIALETADDLRPDFTPGERYILARGPAPEYAFAYVVVPPEKVAEVARIAPLSSLTILARVRSGRSAYLANPILELVDVVR